MSGCRFKSGNMQLCLGSMLKCWTCCLRCRNRFFALCTFWCLRSSLRRPLSPRTWSWSVQRPFDWNSWRHWYHWWYFYPWQALLKCCNCNQSWESDGLKTVNSLWYKNHQQWQPKHRFWHYQRTRLQSTNARCIRSWVCNLWEWRHRSQGCKWFGQAFRKWWGDCRELGLN